MPTIHRENGLEFYFFADDHNPAHLHIEKGSAEAKILIETGEVIFNHGLKAKELKKAVEIIEENKALFLIKFREFINE